MTMWRHDSDRRKKLKRPFLFEPRGYTYNPPIRSRPSVVSRYCGDEEPLIENCRTL
jgi:hypothetical protein